MANGHMHALQATKQLYKSSLIILNAIPVYHCSSLNGSICKECAHKRIGTHRNLHCVVLLCGGCDCMWWWLYVVVEAVHGVDGHLCMAVLGGITI